MPLPEPMTTNTHTIVLYTIPNHLNSITLLADFIATRYPSISLIILTTAAADAPPSTTTTTTITHYRLPAPSLPQNTSFHDPILFFQITRLNNPNLVQFLQQTSNIRALILDFFCNSAFQVSTALNIPTYFFTPTNAFGLCNFLYWPTIHNDIPTDMAELNDFINIPGGPAIHSSDFPRGVLFRSTDIYNEFLETSLNMRRSAGIIVNSFYALEVRSMEALINGLCVPEAEAEATTPPVYGFGPLIADVKAGVEHECLQWLDLQPSKSVVFLCFGREGVFSGQQMKETADGLERSGWRFLWTVREEPGSVLPEGFLERTKGRGFVVRSWAPQREVLSHDAVGGFVTHCGQSSVLEAVASGVPMIAWPLYAEQRLNRVVMVEQMRVALAMDAEEDGLVRAAEVERRVRELMELRMGRELRRHVEEMKLSAAAAVRKGGSSEVALERFVEAVMAIVEVGEI